MAHEELFRRYQNDNPDPFLRELPQTESMVITALRPISVRDFSLITDQFPAIQISPARGAFIPDRKWGMTMSFGPCSLAILTGSEDRIWVGHLKPGQSLPVEVISFSRSYTGQRHPLHLTLIGGCYFGDFDMNSARQAQFDTISRQFSEAHLNADLSAFWNPHPETWLTAFVQSLSGRANVYIGFER